MDDMSHILKGAKIVNHVLHSKKSMSVSILQTSYSKIGCQSLLLFLGVYTASNEYSGKHVLFLSTLIHLKKKDQIMGRL